MCFKREYATAEKCFICFKQPTFKNKKILDHCHYAGLYKAASHNNWNLKCQIPDHIPIVVHSLNGYDTHLFIRELGKNFKRLYWSYFRKEGEAH